MRNEQKQHSHSNTSLLSTTPKCPPPGNFGCVLNTVGTVKIQGLVARRDSLVGLAKGRH